MHVVLIMFVGVACGYFLQRFLQRFLQNRPSIGSFVWLNKIISGAIFLLVLLLGIAVGANNVIMNNMTTIGLKGLLIGVASLMGSVLVVWGISKLLN